MASGKTQKTTKFVSLKYLLFSIYNFTYICMYDNIINVFKTKTCIHTICVLKITKNTIKHIVLLVQQSMS